jgi:hypothetical protein
MESWSLRMFSECLDNSSMRPGVPFVAPRQLGAIGGQLGRPNLPSVGWCTGQSGAPPDSHCSCLVHDLLPFLAHPTVGPRRQLAHRTLSGVPNRPLLRATRLPRIARPTVGSPDSPVHHRTVRWIIATSPFWFPESDEFAADDSPDSPVHHRSVWWILAVRRRRVPRAAFSRGPAWRTGHCPVHHRTVRCARPS